LQEIRDLSASERKKVWGPDTNREVGKTHSYLEKRAAAERKGKKAAKSKNKGQNTLEHATTVDPVLAGYAASSKRTKAEIHMEEILDKYFPGFRPQIVIGWYIADFLNEKRKLIVEVDGEIHFFKTAQDAQRTRDLNKLGFTVVRFTNHEVLECPVQTIGRVTKLRGSHFELQS
jgi:very-short-patch-repair endonuclease